MDSVVVETVSLGSTSKGLRWVLAGLCVAFASSVVAIALESALLAITDMGIRLLVADLFVLVPLVAVALTCTGLVGLKRGREELGPAHARDVRWAFLTSVPTAASAGLYFASGLVLGYLPIPTSPMGFLGLTPLAAVVGVHHVAAFLLAVCAGLFLFWTIRSLGTSDTTVLAGAAIALGILSAFEAGFLVDVGLAPLFLTAASLGLWVLAYAASLFHLRRMGFEGGANPVAT